MRKLPLLLSAIFSASPVGALAASDPVQSGLCLGSGACKLHEKGLQPRVGVITGILMLVAAAVAVIIIIISGIRYITSTGDATRVKQAKDTLMYAVVGLVVVILAYAVVNFIIKQVS